MTSQTAGLAAVVERVEILERELRVEKRRNRWLVVAVGLATVGCVLAWTLANTTATAQAQGVKAIRANQFIIEDQNGKSRAELAVDRDGPGLALLDETGRPRVSLDVFKSGPILNVFDQNGNSRAILEVTSAGPRLTLRDETGKPIWSQP